MKSRFFRTSLILFTIITLCFSFSFIGFAEDTSEENGVFESAVSGNVVESTSKENPVSAKISDTESKSEVKDSKVEVNNKDDISDDQKAEATKSEDTKAEDTKEAETTKAEDKEVKTETSTSDKEIKEDSKSSADDNLDESAPKITAIIIEGNNTVPTDEIIKVMSMKIGDPLIASKVQRDIQSIFDLGMFTDVKIDQRYFIGGVKVIFTVLENPVVKNIVFEGNTVVDSEKLLSLMETKVGNILNTKTLFGDTNSINQYYNDELGYLLKPTHIKDVNWTESGDLKIKIADGMVVNDIEIVGNTAYTTEKLRSFLTFKKGELFNQKTAKADTDKIAALYEKDDYILDTIRPTADPATGLVTIKIVEAVVEDIKVEGNTRTKDYVVFRHMNTKVGQILKRKRIQKDLERLNNIGYFSSVNIEPEAGSDIGKVVLAIKVKEQKTGQVSLGLGYTGGGSSAVRSGVTGGISISERNFKGTGWGASTQFQAGVNSDFFNVSIFNPAINSNRDSLSFAFYTQNYKELAQVVPESKPVKYSYYDDKRTGFVVSYGHPLSEFFTVYLSFKTERIKLTRSGISDYEPVGMFDGRANSGTLSAVYDNRDDLFNPKTGTFISASVQSAGGFFGGDEEFTKTQLEIRKYIPVGKSMTLALRAWGGIVNGDSFSSSDVFYLGGADSLRAYHDNIFMGDRMILLNAELRFPIAKLTVLSGAIFVDAGNAWFHEQGSPKLHTDAGIGLRLTLPTLGLGVIRLDYATGDEGSRVTIGFGQSF